MDKNKQRLIKLQPLYRNYRYKPVPFLRLSGKWLQEVGFDIDTLASVTITDGKLIICPAENEPDDK